MRNMHIVKNGIFYTPESIATELVSGIKDIYGDEKSINILDPSCGEGALLRGVEKVLGSNHTFHGCDLFQPKNFPEQCNWLFFKTDFFDYSTSNIYDLIVTNPPYIQAGNI